MTTKPEEEVDNTQPPNRPMGSPAGRVGFGLGVASLVVGGVAVANFTQIVDLFSHRWTIVVLVLGFATGCVGVFLLMQLHQSQLGRSLVMIIALIAVGTMGFGFAIGSSARTDSVAKGGSADPTRQQGAPLGTSTPATATSAVSAAPPRASSPSPASLSEQIEILFPRDGDKVEWKGSVQVAVRELKPNQFIWINIRPTDIPQAFLGACVADPRNAERFNCGVQYGDEIQSRGTSFDIWAVVIDRQTHQTFSEIQRNGHGYDVNDPRFDPIAKSKLVRIQRY